MAGDLCCITIEQIEVAVPEKGTCFSKAKQPVLLHVQSRKGVTRRRSIAFLYCVHLCDRGNVVQHITNGFSLLLQVELTHL